MLFLALPLILVIGTILLLLGRGIFFSWATRNIDQMILDVTSIEESLWQFESLLEGKLHRGGRQHSWQEAKAKNHKMLLRILTFLGHFGQNSRLFRELARHEIRSVQPGQFEGEPAVLARRLFQGTGICRALIMAARVQVRFWMAVNGAACFLLPQKVSPLLARSCRRLLAEYGEIRELALRLASHHGKHYYDNLFSAL